MEWIILSLGYFALLGGLIYKGAHLPEVLAAAGAYVTMYLGFRKKTENKRSKRRHPGEDEDE